MSGRRALLLLAALALPAAGLAADSFDSHVTFGDGTPGVLHARVEKTGDGQAVTCEYLVSQKQEMGLADMPLGSWHGTEAKTKKLDEPAVRALCLDHYEDRETPQ